jgi:glutamine synthetase
LRQYYFLTQGTEGIKNKLEPPKITEGNTYEKKDVKRPPVDMASALRIFENSEFIRKNFGQEVHQHLINFYKNEVDCHEKNVTKWEYGRYFDLI